MTRLDHNGTVLDRMEYYPFGDTSMQTAESKRYRYVGKELDSETGLHYYGARYYAAWVGRFVSVDPLAIEYPHLSSYNYAANRPILEPDVDGLQTESEPTRSDSSLVGPPIPHEGAIEVDLDSMQEAIHDTEEKSDKSTPKAHKAKTNQTKNSISESDDFTVCVINVTNCTQQPSAIDLATLGRSLANQPDALTVAPPDYLRACL